MKSRLSLSFLLIFVMFAAAFALEEGSEEITGMASAETFGGTSTVFVKLMHDLQDDKPYKMVVANQWSNITSVDVMVNKPDSSVKITFYIYENLPGGTSRHEGLGYRYVRIDQSGLNKRDLVSLQFTFEVDKYWLELNNFEPEGVHMYFFEGDRWTQLKNVAVADKGDVVEYAVDFPGFESEKANYFGFIGKDLPTLEQAVEQEEERTIVVEKTEVVTETKYRYFDQETIRFSLVAVLILAILGVILKTRHF